jgi:peroxiredoxin
MLLPPVYSYAGEAGTVAPSFSLADLNGKTVTLEQFRGKVVFLNFWALWCGPCREELPELDRLYRKYGKEGLEVIGICMETSEARVSGFLRKAPVMFPILMDKNGDTAEAYRFSGLPSGFIIGRDGVIRHRHMGFGRELLPEYEKEIMELLKLP